MGQIKWVLRNIDSISKNIQDNMVENGVIRSTINHLMNNDVNFTSISGFHSKVASAMALNLYLPTKTYFLICSYGREIYSFKWKKLFKEYTRSFQSCKLYFLSFKRIHFTTIRTYKTRRLCTHI